MDEAQLTKGAHGAVGGQVVDDFVSHASPEKGEGVELFARGQIEVEGVLVEFCQHLLLRLPLLFVVGLDEFLCHLLHHFLPVRFALGEGVGGEAE